MWRRCFAGSPGHVEEAVLAIQRDGWGIRLVNEEACAFEGCSAGGSQQQPNKHVSVALAAALRIYDQSGKAAMMIPDFVSRHRNGGLMRARRLALVIASVMSFGLPVRAAIAQPATAIVHALVIDGNGGTPIQDGVVLV